MNSILTAFNYRKGGLIASLAASCFVIAACGGNNNGGGSQPMPKPTIFEIAADDDRFDSLELALTTTGLDAALDDETATYTVFAPTDDAFAKLGDALTALLGDPDTLAEILKYHVINNAAVDSATAISLAGNTQEMLNGSNIAITLQGNDLYINNAKVIITDIMASNGIIHAIDTVITPPTPTYFEGTITDAAVATPELSTLVAALTAAELTGVLADETKMFTVFAPLNSAFDKIDGMALDALLADKPALSDVLLYHVFDAGDVDSITALSLSGQSVTMANGDKMMISMKDGELYVNDSKVVTKDIVTNNGTVHLIDTVLMPPTTIVDVAVANGGFTKLVAALQATGLDETLADTSKNFTVFAPTDAAFEALGAETLNSLLADPDALTPILLYHVLIADDGAEAVNAETALSVGAMGGTVTTANGGDLTLTIVDGSLYINDAKVILTDVMADNGIIHVIDKVIVPAN